MLRAVLINLLYLKYKRV